MVAIFPVGRDLMPCFHRDSIRLPRGPYDQSNSCHVPWISACKLLFDYYRSFGILFSGYLLYYLLIYQDSLACAAHFLHLRVMLNKVHMSSYAAFFMFDMLSVISGQLLVFIQHLLQVRAKMLFKLFLGLLECKCSLSRLVFLQYFEECTTHILSKNLRGIPYYSQSLQLIPSLFSVEH